MRKLEERMNYDEFLQPVLVRFFTLLSVHFLAQRSLCAGERSVTFVEGIFLVYLAYLAYPSVWLFVYLLACTFKTRLRTQSS